MYKYLCTLQMFHSNKSRFGFTEDCNISSILTRIGSTNPDDLNYYCSDKYKNNNNFSLSENQSCTVESNTIRDYPKGTKITCKGLNLDFTKPITQHNNKLHNKLH